MTESLNTVGKWSTLISYTEKITDVSITEGFAELALSSENLSINIADCITASVNLL
jgi:hypothetical protein